MIAASYVPVASSRHARRRALLQLIPEESVGQRVHVGRLLVVRTGTVAVLALVVATSGTSYAAAALAKNSVGNYQMKDSAIKSVEVANGSLSAADLSAAARGSLQAPATVPSKKTLKGIFGLDDHASAGGQDYGSMVSYGTRFASALTVEQVTGSPTANCPGSQENPLAKPGFLCVYPGGGINATGGTVVTSGFAGLGFEYRVTSAAAGDIVTAGTWAATAS